MKKFFTGLVLDNPVFGLFLGICSTLAITINLNNALGMGLSVIVILMASNVVISAIRKITPDEIRIPVYIVVIATLVKAVELLIKAYAPAVDIALGVFIPLIVVNCIILGRAEAFASKNGIAASAWDGFSMGLAYTLGLIVMSLSREILATGMVTLINPFNDTLIFSLKLIPAEYNISMFSQPVGAFLMFALIAAAVVAFKDKVEAKEKKEAK